MPIRIQRKRSKGWRAPEGAVYVGRPTVFGNPFPVSICGRERAVAAYRDLLDGFFGPSRFEDLTDEQLSVIVGSVNRWQSRRMREYIRPALRGKDLMCWCGLNEACHADALLEFANSGGR